MFGPGPNTTALRFAQANLSFAACTAGGLAATASCDSSGVYLFASGVSAGSATPVEITGSFTPACTFTVTSLPGCKIEVGPISPGEFPHELTLAWAAYNNATSQLTFGGAGGTLRATWTSACAIFATRPDTAAATFGSNFSPPGNLVYSVTSAYKPHITVV